MGGFVEREDMMKLTPAVVPVEPGTVLSHSPEHDTDNWLVSGWTWHNRPIPFIGKHVFEVKSYILDRDGGHVTFERAVGTYDVYGGGRIEDIKFPYPHPMFEVVGEAEAARIKSEWKRENAARRSRRRWSWHDWLRFGLAGSVPQNG